MRYQVFIDNTPAQATSATMQAATDSIDRALLYAGRVVSIRDLQLDKWYAVTLSDVMPGAIEVSEFACAV